MDKKVEESLKIEKEDLADATIKVKGEEEEKAKVEAKEKKNWRTQTEGWSCWKRVLG